MMREYFLSWLRSFRAAFSGIIHAFASERNFRFHCAALVVVAAAGVILRLGPAEWAVVCLACGLVIGAELQNTALERLADYASGKEIHSLIKQAKDAAAGSVLVASIAAAGAGLFIFIRALFKILR